MINRSVAHYITVLAQENHTTLSMPVEDMTAEDAIREVSKILAPEVKTNTEGTYTAPSVEIAFAAKKAELEFYNKLYGAESQVAARLGDTEMHEISGRLLATANAEVQVLEQVVKMAKIRLPRTYDMADCMAESRRSGELNWPYVGMLLWEERHYRS